MKMPHGKDLLGLVAAVALFITVVAFVLIAAYL